MPSLSYEVYSNSTSVVVVVLVLVLVLVLEARTRGSYQSSTSDITDYGQMDYGLRLLWLSSSLGPVIEFSIF